MPRKKITKTTTRAKKTNAKKTGKHPGGRPSKYNPDLHPKLVKAFAMAGLTDAEIAQEIGINPDTLYRWFNQYPEFSEAKKEGKAEPDLTVEASLFHRAKGYSHDEDKIFYDSKRGETVVVKTKKHYPPDPTAMIFWLKNRRPDKWRDRHDHNISGSLAIEDGEKIIDAVKTAAEKLKGQIVDGFKPGNNPKDI